MGLPPEITKAIRQCETWQEEAWLEVPMEICGIPVMPMTLRHFFLLQGAESPFVNGANFTPADIGVFLWIVSPSYVPCPKERDAFAKRVAHIKIAQAEREINAYVEQAFSEADTAEDENKAKKYANFIAYQIDMFAKEYGWCVQEILDLPMAQVFQLNTAIAERYARESGKKYTKLRYVDMIEARALLDQAKAQRTRNN